jgi:hypothetical protein
MVVFCLIILFCINCICFFFFFFVIKVEYIYHNNRVYTFLPLSVFFFCFFYFILHFHKCLSKIFIQNIKLFDFIPIVLLVMMQSPSPRRRHFIKTAMMHWVQRC